jgi:rRNA small subunit pseudouridine methyltransferase Nep1
MSLKRKNEEIESNHEDDDDGEEMENNKDEIPFALKNSKNTFSKRDSKRLIVVLENANLETVKVGKQYELLNCDHHKQQIIKYKKDPSLCRPDITHQCLLMLLDSPLNRAGLLQIYIHTNKQVLIEVNPQTRIPRTFDRFCGLMVQLLHKLSIRASDTSQKLLKVIKNPITDHLPVGCPKYSTSFTADRTLKPNEISSICDDNEPVVVVIGAFAKGNLNVDYTDKSVSISNYPLSAAITCARFCMSFEEKWNVF